jgi:hypothetical protein
MVMFTIEMGKMTWEIIDLSEKSTFRYISRSIQQILVLIEDHCDVLTKAIRVVILVKFTLTVTLILKILVIFKVH